MDGTGIEAYYAMKDGKKLAFGYTTGTCAAGAAKAAAQLLLTGRAPERARILTPKGIELSLPVLDASSGEGWASCAVRKYSGDDPDVTDGMLIYARVAPSPVEEIRIGTSRMCRSNVGRPFEIRSNPQVEAQFSIPYTVSIALNCGACELPHFREDFILRPEWQAYARKVSVFEDPALPEKEIRSASPLARLKDGRELSAQIETFLGHPDNPVSTAFCLQKFDSCADCGRKHFSKKENKL